MPSLGALRHLFGFLISPPQASSLAGTEQPLTEGQDQSPAADETITREREVVEMAGPGGGGETHDERPPELGRLLTAYLGARAEEALALLVEGLAREMTHELRQAVEETGKSTSSEIGEVREGVASSQREFSRIGRELVRSGAALESIQAAVSAVGLTLERLESFLLEQLRHEQAGDDMELAERDEVLATLDGLETGLEAGRALVRALAGAQARLKDATVQRWWRAMGEATGVKRPLPEVPLADLESLVSGLELTYRRLQDALARHGVIAIEAVGKPFDPNVHEAVAVEPCPEEQNGLVLREQRRGYRTTERVIRLSQVVVGRGEPNKAIAKRGRPRTGRGEQIAEADRSNSQEG